MRQFTTESQGTNTYYIYEIGDDEKLDELSVGMIINNHISGIIPLTFYQKDAKRFMQYNISSRVLLRQFFSGSVTKKRVLEVFRTIAETLLLADDYMLHPRQFLLDMDHIFVNVGTAEAYIICIPMLDMNTEINYAEFFKGIMYQTQFEQNENCDYIPKLLNYLNGSGSFSLDGFRKLLLNLLRESNNSIHQEYTKQQRIVTPVNRPIADSQLNSNVITTYNDQSIAKQSHQAMTMEQNNRSEVIVPSKEKKGFLFLSSKKNGSKEKPAKKEKAIKKEKSQKTKKEIKDKKGGVSAEISVPGIQIPGVQNSKSNLSQAQTPIPKNQTPVEIPSIPTAPPLQMKSCSGFNQNDMGTETTVLSEEIGETVVLGVSQKKEMVNTPYLVQKDNNEKILINKPVFRLGSAKDYVDFCIANRAISRSHADILIINNVYHIRDNNSLNHTFVDQVQIPSQVEVPLEDKTEIRLANEEFEFRLH